MTKPTWLTLTMGLISLLALAACEQAETPTQTEKVDATVTAPALLRQPATKGAEVYFVSPQDGATLSNPVVVRFGLRNMGVAPAGVAHPDTGHHHLLIDTELAQMNLPIPADERHVHFGGGQTETAITLSPGEHTLQLVLGDYLHIPHDPPVTSSRIKITVLE